MDAPHKNNAESPVLQPGTMVDHYKVIRQIGRGGMGEVYLARDTELGRRVALKIVLASALRLPEARDRFLREARLTARFSHPHIITVYGVGQYDSMPYVALEFLEGETLAQRLDEEPPGLKQGLRVALAMAEGLAEAHRHGVLHRDLKPENVFIPRDGRIRVLDFGLAKRVEGVPTSEDHRPVPDAAATDAATTDAAATDANTTDADNLFQTQAMGIQGTPAYMSPEQWFQMAESASDIWALGLILGEVFSGTHPFEDLDLNAVWAAASDETPLPSLGASGVNLPPNLVDLVDACVRKKPADRPTADQVVNALQRLLADIERRPTADESPFRGLLPFQERHAHLFFGREEEVGAFIERIRQEPVLPVVGPSGAGKSSFVQAGVIPRLREYGRWLVIRMRPGSTPFQTLANRLFSADSDTLQLSDFAGDISRPIQRLSLGALGVASSPYDGKDTLPMPQPAPGPEENAPERPPTDAVQEGATVLGTAASQLAETLRQHPQRLAVTLGELAETEQCRVLLLVDQLEELYTLVADKSIRRAFMQALCTAADDPASPVRVVFTLRDDFLWRLAEGAEAREVLGRVAVLGPPDTDALVGTLTEPLATLGYSFEDDDLPREMVAAVRHEPAALPLLQFAAQQLWQKRDRKTNRLTRHAYASIGGVVGALARHADGVLKGMTPPQVDVARRLLLRLVTPESTRQVCPRSELTEGLGDQAPDVLERLTRERIVITRKGRQEAELELVHESLIRAWSRLARWLEESREERAFLDEVGQAATLWQKRGQLEHEVWRGTALADGLRQAHRCATLPGRVNTFLEAGQHREQRRARRRKLLLATVVAVLTLVALTAVVVSLALRSKEQEARLQRDRARVQQAEALRQRTEALRQRTEALREGARSALARGAFLEAKSKLRGALEARDTTLARSLWWRFSWNPLLWKKPTSAHLYSVSFAPDGRSLALGSMDQTVQLIDLDTGLERVLRGHRDQVYTVTYSKDGRHLASGTWSGEVILWDVSSGKGRTLARSGGGWGLAFSPDGRLLVSGGSAPEVQLLDVATGQSRGRLVGHQKSIYAVAFSPNGRIIATASMDKTVRLWDVETKQSLAVLRGHGGIVTRVTFSPDGRLLVSSSTDRTVRIWNVKHRRLRTVLSGHRGAVYGVSFSPDGKVLATGSHDLMVRLWRVADGVLLGRFEGHTARLWDVAFSPDGKVLASVASDRSMRLWKVAQAPKDFIASGHTSSVVGVTFSPDGASLATAGHDRSVRVWDRRQGRVLMVLTGHTAPVNSVTYDRTGRLLATTSDDQTIRVWDLASRKIKMVIRGHTAPTFGIRFSHDGRTLISTSGDKTVRLWETTTGRALAVLRGHRSLVVGLDLSPNGRRIASIDTGGETRIWDLATRRQRGVYRGHSTSTCGVAFSPDAHFLVTTNGDKPVRVWDLKTSGHKDLGRHSMRVYRAVFHPDGRKVATSCADGVARIWDRTRNTALMLRGHRGEVNHLAFSPNGRHLATTGDDNTVRLWNARTGAPMWRAPLLLRSTLELCTHRGWIRLAPSTNTNTPTPPKTPTPRWRRAVATEARLADATSNETRLCLVTHSGDLQHWDMGKDRRLAIRSPKLPRAARLMALWNGCVTLSQGVLRYHQGGGPATILKKQVTAISAEPGNDPQTTSSVTELLVASGGQIHHFNAKGRIGTPLPGGRGVTALARVRRWIVLGFKDGGMELVPTGRRSKAPTFSFESTPASAVVTLAPGPRGTIIAGYGNGAFGIWSVKNGARLVTDRLHGPVIHLLLRGQHLFAVSELGDLRTLDLSAFHTPYCKLMNAVWKEIPILWKGGVPVRSAPPPKHRCRRP